VLHGQRAFISAITGIGEIVSGEAALLGLLGAITTGNLVIGMVAILTAVLSLFGFLIFDTFYECLFAINQNLEKINNTLSEGRGNRQSSTNSQALSGNTSV